MLEPEEVADAVMDAFRGDNSLILPHPQVKTYMQRRASDYDRWLRGMQRLKDRYAGGGRRIKKEQNNPFSALLRLIGTRDIL